MKKKWMTVVTAAVLIAVTVVGYLSVSADYGDQNDPLVSLSYISQVVLPQANATIQNAFSTTKGQFDQTMAERIAEARGIITELLNDYNSPESVDQELLDEVSVKLAALLQSAGTAQAKDEWKVVRLTSGQTLKGQVGCQMLLRFGEATVVAESEPGLINLTSSNELNTGAKLATNNLYMVTIKNNGIKAGANATLLVCGTYAIQ